MSSKLQRSAARFGHLLEHGVAYVPLPMFLFLSSDTGSRLLLWPALARVAAVTGPLLLNRRLFSGGRLRLDGSL